MPIECPRCHAPLAQGVRVCPRCAHDLLQSATGVESRGGSTLWLILKSIAILGAALVGVPVAGPGLPDRSQVQGGWRRVMITGKVVAVGGCLWSAIAFYTAHTLQLWAAIPVVVLGLSMALVGRTSPEWSRG
jgi:hypothetical protein